MVQKKISVLQTVTFGANCNILQTIVIVCPAKSWK